MPHTSWMARDDWVAAAETGPAPAATLRKTYVADVTAADGAAARTLRFTISTGTPDRDRDVISPEGWTLTAYKRNPVVLWAHDYRSLPIGKGSRIKVEDGALKADVEFAPAEANPLAESVFQLVKSGFLSATSVGFRPLKHAFNSERGGMDFEKQELLEFSIVPVPANAEALLDGKAPAADVAVLKAWATETLTVLDASGSELPKTADDDADECPREDCPMREGKSLTADPDPRLDALLARTAAIEATLASLDAKWAPAPTPVVAEPEVLELAEDPPPDDTLVLDAATVEAAVSAALDAVVTREVRGAINALRGRID